MFDKIQSRRVASSTTVSGGNPPKISAAAEVFSSPRCLPMSLYLRLLSSRPLSPALSLGFGMGFLPLFSSYLVIDNYSSSKALVFVLLNRLIIIR